MSEKEFIEISELVHEWRDIEGYEGLYKVSEYGDVMAIKNGKKKIISQSKNNVGYIKVNLYKNGNHKTALVHRLVATAFCEGADYFTEVNHIDEDKTNNHYSNLEWCTREYNVNYGTRNEKQAKKVRCVELNTIFSSVNEAANYISRDQASVSDCLRGKTKTSGGYHWEYVD